MFFYVIITFLLTPRGYRMQESSLTVISALFFFITRDKVFELIETTHIDLVVISQTKVDRS